MLQDHQRCLDDEASAFVVVAFAADVEKGWHASRPQEVRVFVPVRDSGRIEALSFGEALAIDEAEVVGLPSSVVAAVALAAVD